MVSKLCEQEEQEKVGAHMIYRKRVHHGIENV